MIVRPATEDDDEEATDTDEQSLKPGDVTGYQVSSASITLDDIVRSKDHPVSLTTSTTLTDPMSSKATLLTAFANSNAGPLSLTFPSFKSAPLAFAFLTNGARAWKAFVRPYPLAVVGLPNGWEWDLNRAVFELKVRVGPNDRAGPGTPADADSEFITQEEATEIFVPLLHFAKDDIVKRAFGIPVTQRKTRGTNTPPKKASVPVSVPLLNDMSTVSLSMDSSKARTSEQNIEMDTTPGSRSTSQEREDEPGMEDALELDVTANGGRWVVEGQVLKWWYPIPTTTTSQATDLNLNLNLAGSRSQSTTSISKQRPSSRSSRAPPKIYPDGTIEYTITIQRRGGAIDFKRLGVPENWVGMGPKVGAQSKNGKDREGGNKVECCGDGCLIA